MTDAQAGARRTWRFVVPAALATIVLLPNCARLRPSAAPTFPEASMLPPAGLEPREVPLFVCFGSDDNGYSGLEGSGAGGGLHFLTALFAATRNPQGAGDPLTFDGEAAHYSFYVNSRYLDGVADQPPDAAYGRMPREDPALVSRAWREAVDAGNEVGNHTRSHPHGREMTVPQWVAEMRQCTEALERPLPGRAVSTGSRAPGLGLAPGDVLGFRTPYLEYSDATLTAAQEAGFAYDCSLEEGTQPGQDGRNFVWPYRLDRGSPGNPAIGPHPGLWEIPVYVFVVPPDSECARLGVARGLRDRLKARQAYFDTGAGKITGMDWNLWCEFAMTPAEFLATVEYTLERRLDGNRCPLTIGLHSELYSDRSADGSCSASPAERRAALETLVRRVKARPEVRIVSERELLRWLLRPVPLQGAPRRPV